MNLDLAASHPPADPPDLLYKYCTSATALAVLQATKLRCRSPIEFNDPFDGQWDPFWLIQESGYAEAVADAIIKGATERVDWEKVEFGWRVQLSSIRQRHANMVAKEGLYVVRARYVNAAREAAENCRRESPGFLKILAKVRLLCLGEDAFTPTMWSHYADSHAGVVLGFHTDSLRRAWEGPLLKVNYCESLPVMMPTNDWPCMIFSDRDNRPFDSKVYFGSKSHHWAYEKEWRLLTGSSGIGFVDHAFPRSALRSIYIGCRVGVSVPGDVIAIVRRLYPWTRVSRLSVSRDRFALVESEVLHSGAACPSDQTD